jgi:organic radical activating enzyme
MDNFFISDIKNNLFILLFTICNKRCSYCKLKTKWAKNTNYEEKFDFNNLEKLNNYNLNSYDSINILGGEIGLLSKEELDFIFNYFKNKNVQEDKLCIFTNGLFLEKYFEIYKNIKFKIYYHIIDFDSFIDYSKYNREIALHYIIYNEDSINDAEKLLKTYPKFKFDIILDINLTKKDITDNFFNKLKYLFETYENIIINKENVKEMFKNKKILFLLFLIWKRIPILQIINWKLYE